MFNNVDSSFISINSSGDNLFINQFLLYFPLCQELWAISAPRPGINSSSESGPSIKGSRINPKTSPTCLWDENPSPRGPRKHGESVQTAIRKRLLGPIPPLCTEVTPDTSHAGVTDLSVHHSYFISHMKGNQFAPEIRHFLN